MQPLPIGVSDFRKLRTQGLAYLDKTSFIVEVLAGGAEVKLITRPRRFGKTVNLSTLRYFLERSDEDATPLFDALTVWRAGDAVRAHFQRYPVLSVSFKDVKAATFADCLNGFELVLRRELERHREDAQRAASATERDSYQRLLDGSAGQVEYEG